MPENGNLSDGEPECPFCRLRKDGRVIAGNGGAYAIYDSFPVTEGHILIIPVRHFPNFFEITASERRAVFDLLGEMREKLLTGDSKITGFNVGINVGRVAGQTVPHCHIHLIPRRQGDTDHPRGGVRGIIPGKRAY
jgi:ATP adenylyltransferase